MHALHEVIAHSSGKSRPAFYMRHLFTKNKPAKIVANFLHFRGIGRRAELRGQLEKFLFPLLTGFDALFQQLDNYAVVA